VTPEISPRYFARKTDITAEWEAEQPAATLAVTLESEAQAELPAAVAPKRIRGEVEKVPKSRPLIVRA
jgi:hypothetical protein